MSRPATMRPDHWAIFERTQKIKDPVALAKVTQSIMSKPELVAVATKHGLLDWLRASSTYRAPVGPATAAIAATAASAIVVHATGGLTSTDPRLVAFENEEKRREREFQEESKRRRDEFLRQIANMGDGQAYVVLGIGPDASYDEAKKAYKRLAIAHHPDKGGSEETFDRITKAFAFVVEQLKSRAGAAAQFDTLRAGATAAAEGSVAPDGKRVAFGLIDPKKFDINMFNKVFEATKIQEEEDDGYETWFRDESSAEGGFDSKMPVFSGQYNRDLFNHMFNEHASSKAMKKTDALAISHGPEELAAPGVGHSTVGGGRPREFTAAAGSNLQFTDLRAAYEEHNIITTHDPRAEARQSRRTLNAYEAERAASMGPLTAEEREIEMRRLQAEQMRESDRQRRARDRDEKHAMLYDRMMNTQMLPDALAGVARPPALPAPINPRAPALPAVPSQRAQETLYLPNY